MRQPLTEIARKAFTTVQARALSQGLDLFEELNRVGLLATEPRIQEIQVSALQNMLDRLNMVSPAQLMEQHAKGNSNPGTPAGMYNSLIDWVYDYIAQQNRD
jgi:hypothetical protein